MSKKQSKPVLAPRERAFLVGVELRSDPGLLELEDSLDELELLADTAGLDVVGTTTQKLDHPHSDTYVGSGKVEEIHILVEETLSQIVIFDNELSPRHLRELEEKLGENVRVIDRTALILDIFAQHANTREGKLQVELAQYEYRLPRLTRAWVHLARQAGGGAGRTGSVGGVGLRGPGETQLEVDRREIRKRISSLKEDLEDVRQHRERHRQQRQRSRIPVVALVGYTNAGKSTLLNTISNSDVHVADQLFATLDPTTRRVKLPGNHTVLFTDTVGFIQKLPTQLVAAFRATLEEISSADLLVHVADITHANSAAQLTAVQDILNEIGGGKLPTIIALNKIDQLPDPTAAQEALAESQDAYAISALTGDGIPSLLTAIEAHLYENVSEITVKLPYSEGKLISLFYEMGQVKKEKHMSDHIVLQGQMPQNFLEQFEPFIRKNNKD